MDKATRLCIQRATQAARTLLEAEYAEQLEGLYDIRLDGTIAPLAGTHLDAVQRVLRGKLVGAIEHQQAGGATSKEAVAAYLREAAFTTLNRFVALKMLEARGLVKTCVSQGEESAGFKEFSGLAPGLIQLADHGYHLYIQTLFDEIGREVRVLFDRRETASLLWPGRQALAQLLKILNAPELADVWAEDETIGWVYQYFNGDDERKKMRDESQAPRNSRELAVRNQFFTPRYVVQFLTDNTLGRTWYEMMQGETKLAQLDYLVRPCGETFLAAGQTATSSGDDDKPGQDELLKPVAEVPFRAKKDPRELRILDPACGSGHFLLYAFDLLIAIYEEAWADEGAGVFSETGTQLRADYGSIEELRCSMPALILRHNLHGVDIDPRAAQIAALALWMRAQRAFNVFDVELAQRPSITKTNIVVGEPMPTDAELVEGFAAGLQPSFLGDLFKEMVTEMEMAGELGSLLGIEESISGAITEARRQYCAGQTTVGTGYLPGLEPERKQGELDFSDIDDERFFEGAEEQMNTALRSFAESAAGVFAIRRKLFVGDAAQGVAFIDLMQKQFDVVLMNPPFGAGSLAGKKQLEKSYPRTKNDIYAAFVERGIQLLHPCGMLGAITSRTGFFLSSFQKWREEILLKEAPPVVFADLGHGVLDSAMVEVAAYCLRKVAA